MRGTIFSLATILVAFFCEATGLANVVVQQKPGDPGQAAQEMAERMAESLSKRLPQQLSNLSTEQSARQSKPKPKEEQQKSPEEPNQSSLQASVQDQSGQSSQGTGQGAGQEQADRPRLRLPEDKPLGAAGPSRDKSEPGPEDADFMVVKDRWRIGLPEDPRFKSGSIFNPYRQNVLKGDYPIIGNDIFMDLTFISESFFNLRRLPVPQDISAQRNGSFEFFGRGRQDLINQNFTMSFDMFKGDASFKPVDWRFKIALIANVNYLRARENGVVNQDPREGKSRIDGFNSVEEMFFEWRLGDTTRLVPFLRGKGSEGGRSPFFDTSSMRVGLQKFTSDFRGFIFDDINLGARMFGNIASNRYQYNLAYFNMIEKDTNSGLNVINLADLRMRDQKVYVANVFRQDTFAKGYTLQFSALYNSDQPTTLQDNNLLRVRPARIGLCCQTHHIRSGYFGVNGDGHFGRLNLTNAFYQAIGRDTFNPIARRAQRINAQMAAAEISIDFDWLRYRLAGFYSSGDANVNDDTARGFDSIVSSPNFAGGEFSFWNQQEIRLTQTGAQLVGANNLIPNMRSSQIQGQSNFINPGLALYNAGIDVDVTPKLRAFINYNYLRFHRTEPLEFVLFQEGFGDSVRHEIGHDLGVGFIYRPLLSENIIVTAGASGLRPGTGFTDIYSSNCNGTTALGCGASSPSLWSTFMKVRFQY